MTQHQTQFDLKHRQEIEPWSYSDRAAEILRHQWVAGQAQRLDPKGYGVLDVGCSFGQLSEVLVQAGLNITSMDISAAAVEKTRQRLAGKPLLPHQRRPVADVGSATSVPHPNASFQVVSFSDGLEGWELSPEQKLAALREAWRVLRPGGFAILTDFLHPDRFAEHVELVKRGPLILRETHYLNDRLWFQLNTNLRSLHRFNVVKRVLRDVNLAKMLAQFSSLMGPRGSKHLGLILEKT